MIGVQELLQLVGVLVAVGLFRLSVLLLEHVAGDSGNSLKSIDMRAWHGSGEGSGRYYPSSSFESFALFE